MRVALDCGPLLDPPTGVGRYTRELAAALAARGVEVAGFAFAARGHPPAGVARLRIPARAARLAWRAVGRPAVQRLVGPVDLVHGTNFVLPPTGGVPGVVTVHDLSFERPDAFPGARALRRLVPWSVRRAAAVLVPTSAVAAEVADRYGLDPAKVAVTPEGVSPVFFGATPLADAALARLGVGRPFALAVGTIEPRKNLPRLLEGWRRAARELAGLQLVVAGPRGWGGRLRPAGDVVLPGWVGDETLPGLVAAAEFFCYPSLYEGFGLPPLEAMAAGIPALVGRYPAAPEVLGDAALLVDPLDPDDIARGLVALATDAGLRAHLARAGRARAARYTWEATARATEEAYRRVLGGA